MIDNGIRDLQELVTTSNAELVNRAQDVGTAIGHIVDTFSPAECANYFAAAGYDPD